MKKINRKGFTIVELVIVIAVIAILAAVLIPTFTNVGNKAKESAAMQACKNEFTEYLADKAENLTGSEEYLIQYTESSDVIYTFSAKGASFNSTKLDNSTTNYNAITGYSYTNDKVEIYIKS